MLHKCTEKSTYHKSSTCFTPEHIHNLEVENEFLLTLEPVINLQFETVRNYFSRAYLP